MKVWEKDRRPKNSWGPTLYTHTSPTSQAFMTKRSGRERVQSPRDWADESLLPADRKHQPKCSISRRRTHKKRKNSGAQMQTPKTTMQQSRDTEKSTQHSARLFIYFVAAPAEHNSAFFAVNKCPAPPPKFPLWRFGSPNRVACAPQNKHCCCFEVTQIGRCPKKFL